MTVEFGAVQLVYFGLFGAPVVVAVLGVVAWLGYAYGEAKGKLSKAAALERSHKRRISSLESEVNDLEAMMEGDDE